LKDDEYNRIVELSEKIQRCIADITEVVSYHIDDEDSSSMLTSYSALLSVSNYIEFKLRQSGVENSAIEITKNSAENYVLSLISQELNAIPQKKGDA
jgi:hypothetical protein